MSIVGVNKRREYHEQKLSESLAKAKFQKPTVKTSERTEDRYEDASSKEERIHEPISKTQRKQDPSSQSVEKTSSERKLM